MNKKDYISLMNNIKFSQNLKEETITKIQNYMDKVQTKLNFGYKILIVATSLEVYFFSIGILTCR